MAGEVHSPHSPEKFAPRVCRAPPDSGSLAAICFSDRVRLLAAAPSAKRGELTINYKRSRAHACSPEAASSSRAPQPGHHLQTRDKPTLAVTWP